MKCAFHVKLKKKAHLVPNIYCFESSALFSTTTSIFNVEVYSIIQKLLIHKNMFSKNKLIGHLCVTYMDSYHPPVPTSSSFELDEIDFKVNFSRSLPIATSRL